MVVDVKKITAALYTHFKIEGHFRVDKQTGLVDVTGNVTLISHLDELPVSFGTVSKNFKCIGCGLTTLKGAPRHVGYSFYCVSNNLTSLEHAPVTVTDGFNCSYNQLISLVGAPRHVGDGFNCNNNQLTHLQGAPNSVNGFYCEYNPLTDLSHLPEQISLLWCSYSLHLPLLRLLMYNDVGCLGAPMIVKDILSKYEGKGKAGAIKAAAELIKAGYKENARW